MKTDAAWPFDLGDFAAVSPGGTPDGIGRALFSQEEGGMGCYMSSQENAGGRDADEREASLLRARKVSDIPGKRWKSESRDDSPVSERDLESSRISQACGLESDPEKIGKNELEFLRWQEWRDETSATQRWKFAILNGFLKYCGNSIWDRMTWTWPQDSRIFVDWLSPEETIKMLNSARGVERIVIHLELRLGLRRVEVKRLRISDIYQYHIGAENVGYMNIHGKGRAGGKWRTIAFAPDTQEEIEAWMRERDRMIREGLAKYPEQKIPSQLVIYCRHGRLGSYGDTALDNIVIRVAKRCGIDRPVSNHTLRRTCGRNLHLAGVSIEEIASLLGHSDTKQTMEYLGLTIDDLKRAHELGYSYLKAVEKNGIEVPQILMKRVSR
ncbi:MAG: site-specific integrase [Methanomassiliicoccales archaeon]